MGIWRYPFFATCKCMLNICCTLWKYHTCMKVSFSVEMSLKELSQTRVPSIKLLREPSQSRISQKVNLWRELSLPTGETCWDVWVEEKFSAPERADLPGCKCCFIPTLCIGRVILPKILLIKKTLCGLYIYQSTMRKHHFHFHRFASLWRRKISWMVL